ncbi:MAG: NAD(P)H-dependent oxidoreductase subunit E, partial [Pseudomonadota bacterium]
MTRSAFPPASTKRRRGKGFKSKGRQPKGRQLDEKALDELEPLLFDMAQRRDLLIEYLHRIQDHFGCLHARHLRALAERMRLSMAEIYEVASFYDHFDIIKEHQDQPPPLTIRVCDSVSCWLSGSQKLIDALQSSSDPASIRVLAAPCMGGCDRAPAARIGNREVDFATVEKLSALAAKASCNRDLAPACPSYQMLDAYIEGGGYQTLGQMRDGDLGHRILDILKESGLRGLGGAGFPAHMKWNIVRAQPAPRLM